MVRYSNTTIRDYFDVGDRASTTTAKGRALEDLICYVFKTVPGVSVSKRNPTNAFRTQEIDVAFWNEQHPNGFYFLPHIILAECKNWENPVGTQDITYFIAKVRDRGLDHGVFIATSGITGNSAERTDAHSAIASALKDGIKIIIMTREEIERLISTRDLIRLSKEKLCELAVSGTIFS